MDDFITSQNAGKLTTNGVHEVRWLTGHPSTNVLGDRFYGMASVIFPTLEPEGILDNGTWCLGCRANFLNYQQTRVLDAETRLLVSGTDPYFPLHDLEYRARSKIAFIEHIRVCKGAKDLIRGLEHGVLATKDFILDTKEFSRMELSRTSNKTLVSELSFEALPAVETTWHFKTIDVLSLQQVKRHRSGVHEVLLSGLPAICKIACFGWQIPKIEHETYTYSIIEQYREPGDPITTPLFLGHVAENGRVIGMLLEKLEVDFASMEDLPACRQALENFHRMKMVHGDVNRYNFIVNRSMTPSHVRLVDFEHAEPYEESKALSELQSLSSELGETGGRGGSVAKARDD
ncbi:alpha-galactosidase A [Phlyctema vagabunda]|uniref:Alpha-galactosidase A n=1 Tax=Phlyctema vagabunda TaxID=108571 RepID=A0ABR4PC29_9HELO